MNRAEALVPAYTVSQAYVGISAARPVSVGTYLYYRQADGWQIPQPPDDLDLDCGPTHRIPQFHTVDPHDHAYYEIVLVRGGTAVHRTEQFTEPVSGGTVIVMAPGQVHGFDHIDGLKNTNVYYLNEWLLGDLRSLWGLEGVVPLFLLAALFRRPVSPRIPVFQLTVDEMGRCASELLDIAAELKNDPPCLPYMKWCFLKFLLILSRAYARTESGPPRNDVPAEIQSALESLEEQILEGRTLHVAGLALELGMSADHFSKVFKDATGWSPMDYFQRRRIQHASWMLLNTDFSLTELAHALGYCDSAHFSNLFKRHQGLSPRDYRKMYTAAGSVRGEAGIGD